MIDRDDISEDRLRTLVRQVIGSEKAEIDTWELLSLQYDVSSPTSLGLYRLLGTANDDSKEYPWSVILKAIRSPGGVEVAPGVVLPMWADQLPPTEFGFWQRELFIYRSNMLNVLPGSIAAPRCHGVDEIAPKVFWIWLEDIRDVDGGTWTLSRCAETARHLGQFNGAYLAGLHLPSDPWLQRGWLRSWLEPGRPGAAWQGLPSDAWEHPRIAAAFPPAVRDRLGYLWNDRERLLSALDRLPECFCHRDAWSPNLFTHSGHAGVRETLAVDWAFAGIGPVGEEIAPLIVWSDLPDCSVGDIEDTVLANYVCGLRDAGWDGDSDLVRCGYATTAILRYAFSSAMVAVRTILQRQTATSGICDVDDFGEQIVNRNLRVVHYLLDLADRTLGEIA